MFVTMFQIVIVVNDHLILILIFYYIECLFMLKWYWMSGQELNMASAHQPIRGEGASDGGGAWIWNPLTHFHWSLTWENMQQTEPYLHNT